MVKAVHVRNSFYLSQIETTRYIIQFCELERKYEGSYIL